MYFYELDILFVHIPKTGGTTITYQIAEQLCKDFKSKVGRSIIDFYGRRKRTIVKKGHTKAHTYSYIYKAELGDELYNKLYTFAFLRNPFSQVRSLFYQLKGMNAVQNSRFLPYKTMTFEEYIMKNGSCTIKSDSRKIDQYKFVTEKRTGKVIVKDLFIFEHYEKSLSLLSDKIGIPLSAEQKLRRTSASEGYSPEMIMRFLDVYGHVVDFYNEQKRKFEDEYL